MEEKKIVGYKYSFWSFFSHRNFSRNFFWKFYRTKFSPFGFTLIELLVAIAIIGILAGSVFFVLNPAAQFQKAQDAKRKSDLAQIQKGLELYYQDNGSYPAAVNYGIEGIQWGSSWQPYMGTLPKDPSSPLKEYAYNSDGQTYYLYASLDRGADPQACNSGSACASITNASEACGGTCNIGVSSPNVSVSEIASIAVPTLAPPPAATSTPTPTPKLPQTPIQTNYAKGIGGIVGPVGWNDMTYGYRFRAKVPGKITALWDYSAGGEKTLKLWKDDGTLLRSSVPVTGSNAWEPKDITPYSITVGDYYIVSTYLISPGGYYINNFFTEAIPHPAYGDITIDSACWVVRDTFPNCSPNNINMIGIADITFIPDPD